MKDFFKYDPSTGHILRLQTKCRSGPVGSVVGCVNKHGYLVVRFKGITYRAHRVAWFLHFGVWPKSNIDHINGVRVDNRLINLREATPRENQQNLNCHREGHLPGTTRIKDRWQSQVEIDGKSFYLGRYSTQQEAHAAYLSALREAQES